MTGFLFVTFYAAMAGTGLIVELILGALGLVDAQRNARVIDAWLGAFRGQTYNAHTMALQRAAPRLTSAANARVNSGGRSKPVVLDSN
jgi:hypothetical protein